MEEIFRFLQWDQFALEHNLKDKVMVKFCLIIQLRKLPNLAMVQYALKVILTFMARVGLPLQVNSDSVITVCLKMQMHRSSYAKN